MTFSFENSFSFIKDLELFVKRKNKKREDYCLPFWKSSSVTFNKTRPYDFLEILWWNQVSFLVFNLNVFSRCPLDTHSSFFATILLLEAKRGVRLKSVIQNIGEANSYFCNSICLSSSNPSNLIQDLTIMNLSGLLRRRLFSLSRLQKKKWAATKLNASFGLV